MSKAFLKPINTLIVAFLSSNVNVISSVNAISASNVEKFVLNPHWLFIKMSFLLMKESNLVQNNFSRILENCNIGNVVLFAFLSSVRLPYITIIK